VRRWTTGAIGQAVQMYREGRPVTEIAAVVGHSESSIRSLMSQRRVYRRGAAWSPDQDAALREWRNLAQLAACWGRSVDAVRKRRERLRKRDVHG
jgi:hypothetical protein